MRSIDRRKALRDLSRLCKKHGLKLEVNRSAGKGSHQALIFTDIKTKEVVTITISGHHEISPGVQRDSIKYFTGLGVALADLVAEILKIIFGN